MFFTALIQLRGPRNVLNMHASRRSLYTPLHSQTDLLFLFPVLYYFLQLPTELVVLNILYGKVYLDAQEAAATRLDLHVLEQYHFPSVFQLV